jgi:MFS family permease
MAVVGLIAPLGAVVGPSVGGLLIGAFGWPSIFFINVPFGLLSFLLVARLLAKDSPPGIKAFDFGGAVLFGVSILLLILGLSPVNGRLTGTDLVLLAAAAAAVAGFALVERRAANPLVPVAMVRRARFSVPLAGILLMPFVGAGLGFLVPFFLEVTLGMRPAQAGLTLLFFPLAMAAASQVGGRLSDRFHPRLPAAIGAVISLVGVALIVPLNSGWTGLDVALRLAVVGLGAGFFIAPSSVAVMAATPREHVGVGSALVNTARFLGFSLGPTIATIFWSPGLAGQAGLSAMRMVAIVLTAAQAAALATVIAYRVERAEGAQRRSRAAGGAAA